MEECRRFNRPIPEKIANAPELALGLELFYQGFLDLSSCRALGQVCGPIPMTAILEYCLVHEIEGDQREDFVWILQRLDNKYLDRSAHGSGGIQP